MKTMNSRIWIMMTMRRGKRLKGKRTQTTTMISNVINIVRIRMIATGCINTTLPSIKRTN
jgi:hypothetical protein